MTRKGTFDGGAKCGCEWGTANAVNRASSQFGDCRGIPCHRRDRRFQRLDRQWPRQSFGRRRLCAQPRGAHPGHEVEDRSEEHTSELQSLMRISYAVFCLKKKKQTHNYHTTKTPYENLTYQ